MSDSAQIELVGVVMPVRNEAALLPRALDALAESMAQARESTGVELRLLVVDDASSDGSADIAAARAGVELLRSSARSVGAARALGAAALLDGRAPERVWIASTDGDSAVPANWVLTHLRFAAAGAEALRGSIRPDPADLTLEQLDLWGRLNPPSESHPHIHGCNLGVRGDRYLQAGGFGGEEADEDVRLVIRLTAIGARVLSTDSAPVLTSARTHGRTPDGFARYVRTALEGA
ncbi:glycosyltransferase [Amnibacterium flavum]|uniref:4,4'-diaponeurosporenoate glycosyltransferase n=1 Tax=Amnibacterium flavum TaxID=2173173 RepID=A0A2V1HTW9_9MICO|nr:glycosyltransferase [Amnibacterium flavum]PVZ96018.1 glycosyl transferase [Amnibacterium flavum]